MHVDGAFGAWAAVSPSRKHLVSGIEQADSVVWDAHKMLRTSSLCAAILVRDVRRALRRGGGFEAEEDDHEEDRFEQR